jgi:hypothetical protein
MGQLSQPYEDHFVVLISAIWCTPWFKDGFLAVPVKLLGCTVTSRALTTEGPSKDQNKEFDQGWGEGVRREHESISGMFNAKRQKTGACGANT